MRKAAILLALAIVAEGAGDPESFARGLAAVRALAEGGRCAQGKKDLDALLLGHAPAGYALGRRVEIEELAKQLVFGATVEPPDPKKLVSGELLAYDAHEGTIRIRYGWDSMGDWKQVSGLWVHPAVFDGPHTITIKGTGNAHGGIVVTCFRDGKGFVADFGGGPGNWAELARFDGKARDDLASAPSLFEGGTTYTAKVTVNRTAIVLASGNRANVRCGKKAEEWGTLAFGRVVFREVVLAGKVEPSWIQGLVDAERQRLLAEFAKRWNPRDHLPAWLYDGGGAAPTLARPDGRDWPGAPDAQAIEVLGNAIALHGKGEAAAALGLLDAPPAQKVPDGARDYLRAMLLHDLGRHEDALAACRRVRAADPDFVPVVDVEAGALAALGRFDDALRLYRDLLDRFPGGADLYAHAALFAGAAGRWDEAEGVVRAALSKGVTSKQLEAVSRQVHMALHGPAWPRRHEYESPHYLVLSDMDPKVCFEASQILEQAYAVFMARLERAPAANERFKVFLFSGQTGYQEYVLQLLGTTAPHSAGLYAPALRQLFIWNLREREDMMRTVRHEGFHQYLHRIMDDPPLWFNEGLAEYFEEARVIQGKWTTGLPRRDHLSLLAAPQPLDAFLFLDSKAFMANAFANYAQAWAFMHFLLHTGRENRQLFDRFWEAFKTIPAHADAIRSALQGRSIAALDAEFREHVAAMAKER